MLNRSVPSFFHGKTPSEHSFCPDCESLMILSRLEPDKPGFDLRTYACLMCAATESIVVAIS
jgi:DNA-directed RNA polymerase subunit M/transcription elongation factor TFIIS